MLSVHKFASAVPPGGNPGNVTSSNWNDVHAQGAVPTVYNTNDGVIPTTVDYIRAIGGSGGISLALTSSSQTFVTPSGTFVINQVYFAKKVDAGAGAVTFTDVNGALFEGTSTTYVLSQQGQWAIFIWNGTGWDVFGGQAA